MKVPLDKALSLVAISVLSVISAPASASITDVVYQIENLDKNFDLKGTLEGTRNGYGMGVADVANVGELVGISKGRTVLTEGDIAEGILPEESVSFSVDSPIIANNFAFFAKGNGTEGNWLPEFDSINGTKPPKETNPDDPKTINSVDTLYYGVNADGTKVGTMTGVQKTIPVNCTSDNADCKYYRDFEIRGVAKLVSTPTTTGLEIPLLPPYVTYIKEGQKDTLIGGTSEAKAINKTKNEQGKNIWLVVGSASTGITKTAADVIDACYADGATLPVDICVQANQFPTSFGSPISYQTKAYVWQIDAANPNGTTIDTALPLGFTPLATEDRDIIKAQAFAVSNNANINDVKIAGRSVTKESYDNGTGKQFAAWWNRQADANGDFQYVYHQVPMPNSDYLESLAYGINDSGLLVGRYKSYIKSYIRSKFFTFDTTTENATIDTPTDFNHFPDASSIPRAVNNAGLVVGSIETTADKDIPRQKTAFLFDNSDKEFVDLNKHLTCNSKGYEPDGNNGWKRHPVTVSDGSGSHTYLSEIKLADANSISNDGTIVGTALIRKPKYKTDANGRLELDVNGKPQFELNGNGEPLTQLIPRAVVLKPVSGEMACTVVDPDDVDAPFVRKGGAGLSWLVLLPLVWFRKRFH